MKKIFSLVISLLLIVCSFSACKENVSQVDNGSKPTIKENSSIGSFLTIDTNSSSDISSATESENASKDEESYDKKDTETTQEDTGSKPTKKENSSTESTLSTNTSSSSYISSATESENVLNYEEPYDDEEIDPTEELVGVNKFRPDYDLGNCKDLSGEVTAVVFYLDDFESSWTTEEIDHFTEKEIKPGLKFLENSAQKFGIQLSIKIEEIHSGIYYEDEVIANTKETEFCTADTLEVAAKSLGYSSDRDFINNYEDKYSSEVICYCVFNKEGNSYALNPTRGVDLDIQEHVLMFAYDIGSTGYEPVGWQSSVIAHETLHLYGAEDYYYPEQRKTLALKHYPKDIMLYCKYYLRQNYLGDITAFYIGWTDVVPDVIYEAGW